MGGGLANPASTEPESGPWETCVRAVLRPHSRCDFARGAPAAGAIEIECNRNKGGRGEPTDRLSGSIDWASDLLAPWFDGARLAEGGVGWLNDTWHVKNAYARAFVAPVGLRVGMRRRPSPH